MTPLREATELEWRRHSRRPGLGIRVSKPRPRQEGRWSPAPFGTYQDHGILTIMESTSRNLPAAILLSGGLDSATVLAIARARGCVCHCLTINYGQRHRIELDAARQVAKALGATSHRTVEMDLRTIGGSALTDAIDVPKDREVNDEVPVTYVPARNAVMLSLLLGLAEVLGAADLFIGANAVDYSGYPDCRPAFLEAFERMAALATVAGAEKGVRYRVHAPLLDLTKAEIIRTGTDLGLDYGLTWSCYDPTPSKLACGRCDSCILRRRGFEEAGIPDPTKYTGGLGR